jgi:rubredoxin
VRYDCPNDHHFAVPFAADVEIPNTWECRSCGATAVLVDGAASEPRKTKPARTHWDMLLERRSVPELEALLEERLIVLRDSGRKSA